MNSQFKNEFEDSDSDVGSSTCSREPLSREGVRRRAEMLEGLQVQMARHHERKRRQRGAWCIAMATTGVVLVALCVAWFQWGPSRTPFDSIASYGQRSPNPSGESNGSDSVTEHPKIPNRLSDYVCTNGPDVLDRLVWENQELAQERQERVEQIDDDELVQLFAEAGMSASVGLIGGKKAVIVRRQR